MSKGQPPAELPDPDDFFADTRMSFPDHIEELRGHLWRAVYGFLFALVAAFFVGGYVLDAITAPVKKQLDLYYRERMTNVLSQKKDSYPELMKPTPFRKVYYHKDSMRRLAKGLEPDPRRPVVKSEDDLHAEANPPHWFWAFWFGSPQKQKSALSEDYKGEEIVIPEAEKDDQIGTLWLSQDNPLFHAADQMDSLREIMQLDSPTTLRAEEAFFVWFKVCFVTGLVLGSPWIFYEIWSFIAAGLYPHEKKLVHFYLPISLGLFLVGVVVCQVFVIPKALEALLWFNKWLGFKPDIRLNDWLGFAIFMPLVFGVSFQTPLVMLFLNKLGIMTADTFRGQRRVAWFAMAIFAAIITPSTDAFSMLFLWVPMSLLFELGIVLIALTPPPPPEEEDGSGELVEV
ncbi:MAG: twin-arginine translocase subunit TatC [Gemmataceae bacterium]|nr:twin-arginine translocase subunit TatC [Gemmataceae bacterium]